VRLVGCAVPSRAEHSVLFRPPALRECERADLFGDGSQISLALQWRTRRIASAERGFSGHSAQFVRILRTRRNSLKEYFSKKSIVGRPSSAIAMSLVSSGVASPKQTLQVLKVQGLDQPIWSRPKSGTRQHENRKTRKPLRVPVRPQEKVVSIRKRS
jgi:hypothetical protein